MGKLDNIPKEDFFKTPENYFEKLPAEIQSRILANSKSPGKLIYRYSLQYALPLIAIAVLLFLFIPAGPDAEKILATVETEELIFYLQDSGLSTEDLVDVIGFSAEDVEDLENTIYTDNFPELDSTSIDL